MFKKVSKNFEIQERLLLNSGYPRRIHNIDNKFYIVTSSALFEINDKQNFKSIYRGNIYDVIDFDEKLVISTTNGLYVYESDSSTSNRLNIVNEPPATSYYTSLKDQFGRYWFGTNRGVLMIDFEEGTQRWYDESNGLLGSEVNRGAFMEASNGDILVGTDKGLNVYRYEFDPAISKAPEVEFYKTIINDTVFELDTLALSEEIKAESSDLIRLRFRLKDLYFDDSAIFRYRILKNGSASPWENLSASDDRSISLYYPTAAEYQVELQAKQKNSLWSVSTFSPKIIVSTGISRDSVLYYLLATLGLIVAFLLIQKARKH